MAADSCLPVDCCWPVIGRMKPILTVSSAKAPSAAAKPSATAAATIKDLRTMGSFLPAERLMSHKGFAIEILPLPFCTALVQIAGCPSLPVPAFLPAGGEDHRYLACVLWPVPGSRANERQKTKAPVCTGASHRSRPTALTNGLAELPQSTRLFQNRTRWETARGGYRPRAGAAPPPRVIVRPRHAAPGRGFRFRFLR